MRDRFRFLFVLLCLVAAGCPINDDGTDDDDNGDTAKVQAVAARPVPVAGGAAAIVINPVVDTGTTTGVTFPDVRNGITVDVNGTTVTTDSTGFLLATDITTDELTLGFGVGSVGVKVDGGSFVDAIVRYDPNGTVDVAREIRYEGDRIQLLTARTYETLEITESGLSLVGEVGAGGELLAIIDGDLILSGNDIQVRNISVTGNIIIRGNDITVAFSEMFGLEITGNNVLLLNDQLLSEPLLFGSEITILNSLGEDDGPGPTDQTARAIPAQPVSVQRNAGAVLINPVVNGGTDTGVTFPSIRDGLLVNVAGVGVVTDPTGFIVIGDAVTGSVEMVFDIGTVSETFRPDGFKDVIVRYEPGGRGVGVYATIGYLLAGAQLLDAGTHSGMEITQSGTRLLGEVNDAGELLTIIDGNLVLSGNDILVRNVLVTGAVSITGNNIAVSYSEMSVAQISGNNVIFLHNRLTLPPVVTGTQVDLLDNVTR